MRSPLPRIIATADCANCRHVIRQEDWGMGGLMWVHGFNGRKTCVIPKHATPNPDTLRPCEV